VKFDNVKVKVIVKIKVKFILKVKFYKRRGLGQGYRKIEVMVKLKVKFHKLRSRSSLKLRSKSD